MFIDIMWEWTTATGKGLCEVKERASCWWSPCENGSVTENRLLPCHTVPEQSTLRGRESSWWIRPKCSVSGLAPAFNSLYDFIDFINLSAHWLISDRWMNGWNESNTWPVLAISSTCTERLLCSYLINGPTAVWVFVFVCIWTANTDEQEPRPQSTKLLHNVADNYHDNIHGLKGETRQRGWSRNAVTLQKSIRWGCFAPMGYGLLVWSIPV